MPLNKSKLKLSRSKLKPGDVLLWYDEDEDEADHSLIWTCGDKPLIHCVETDSFNGAFAESGKKLWTKGPPCCVMRPKDKELALHAARFAKHWATSGVNLKGKLATPYSQDRLINADGKKWGPESYIRAIRAYARGDLARWRADDVYNPQRPILSKNKGVTCSSFVTYCYQAGAIAYSLAQTKNKLIASLIFQMDQHEYFDDLKKRRRYELMYAKLSIYETRLTEKMPKSILVDAKTTRAEYLEEKLQGDSKSFEYIGNIQV